ncbi:hypothetical protein MiSe_33030 [Microseira wollei NIES-4236]|uniref:Transposase n=1 Tax=Microseira wollei NIES-4236 TaxID=2530354 RepID=A0AAV3XEK3_9CYAN|nr:hypothetical protein MiSe_33030 [Microseira wollei NIES-4236]
MYILPSDCALYLSIVVNIPQPTSLIVLAKLWFLTMALLCRFSTAITWFSLTILRDSLWRKSSRHLAILERTATLIWPWLYFYFPFVYGISVVEDA